MSIFEAEVNLNIPGAIKMAEKILGDSIEKQEDLDEEEYKEIDNLIDTVKENIGLWRDQMENAKSL